MNNTEHSPCDICRRPVYLDGMKDGVFIYKHWDPKITDHEAKPVIEEKTPWRK